MIYKNGNSIKRCECRGQKFDDIKWFAEQDLSRLVEQGFLVW